MDTKAAALRSDGPPGPSFCFPSAKDGCLEKGEWRNWQVEVDEQSPGQGRAARPAIRV
jgi:hypothetical protein